MSDDEPETLAEVLADCPHRCSEQKRPAYCAVTARDRRLLRAVVARLRHEIELAERDRKWANADQGRQAEERKILALGQMELASRLADELEGLIP